MIRNLPEPVTRLREPNFMGVLTDYGFDYAELYV
jgi:hypothetical protein